MSKHVATLVVNGRDIAINDDGSWGHASTPRGAMDETRGQFESWYLRLMRHPSAFDYNNPLGLPAEGDLKGAMWLGFQAGSQGKQEIDRDVLAAYLLAFLQQKYVQHADERQKSLGLGYMTAETHDLARELAIFLPKAIALAAKASGAA